jgi:hypothetical protein
MEKLVIPQPALITEADDFKRKGGRAFWQAGLPLRRMSRGAVCPDEPPPRQINPNASHSE